MPQNRASVKTGINRSFPATGVAPQLWPAIVLAGSNLRTAIVAAVNRSEDTPFSRGAPRLSVLGEQWSERALEDLVVWSTLQFSNSWLAVRDKDKFADWSRRFLQRAPKDTLTRLEEGGVPRRGLLILLFEYVFGDSVERHRAALLNDVRRYENLLRYLRGIRLEMQSMTTCAGVLGIGMTVDPEAFRWCIREAEKCRDLFRSAASLREYSTADERLLDLFTISEPVLKQRGVYRSLADLVEAAQTAAGIERDTPDEDAIKKRLWRLSKKYPRHLAESRQITGTVRSRANNGVRDQKPIGSKAES